MVKTFLENFLATAARFFGCSNHGNSQAAAVFLKGRLHLIQYKNTAFQQCPDKHTATEHIY